mgnify:CR=1 FL=1
MTEHTSDSPSSHQLTGLGDHVKKHGSPIFRGIEKEGLRTDSNFKISQTDHPSTLGHPLTHPTITTDYSEALLELITPVHATRESLLNDLEQTHKYVATNLEDEVLWAGSMPCQLDGEDSVRIAEYGDSNIGKLKYVYRQGLGVRYGRVMQSIAGLHFNFSLSDTFWKDYQTTLPSKPSQSLQDFKTEQYFSLIRNFRRYSWLLMYLFGASPAVDQSFLKDNKHKLDQFDQQGTYFKPYATSLRMGDLGYHNNAQSSLAICFNTLHNFTSTLGHAIHTAYPAYKEIGIKRGEEFIQLNTNILQIENEYYSSIRPKRTIHSGETPRHALNERGVEYVEVRCLDLNPFLPLGISEKQIDFLDTFLLYCLLKDSPFIDESECKSLDENFDRVVNEGRKPRLELENNNKNILLDDWATELLQDMSSITEVLDHQHNDQRHAIALKEQLDKVQQPELTPAAQVLSAMKEESLSWLNFTGELSLKHKVALSTLEEPSDSFYKNEATVSFNKAQAIKNEDTVSFNIFMQEYQKE